MFSNNVFNNAVFGTRARYAFVGGSVDVFPLIPFYTLNTLGVTSLPSEVTFTRASQATYINSSGVLTVAANNEPRFDYNPVTLQPLGLLLEGSRTNSVRDGNMSGAVLGVVGAGGVIASTASVNTARGLTTEVVATGTTNGVSWSRVRIFGTPTTTGAYEMNMSSSTAALTSQVWTLSAWVRIAAGSLTGIGNIGFGRLELDSGGGYVSGGGVIGTGNISGSLTANLTRFSAVTTLIGGVNTANARPLFAMNVTSGVAVDITIEFGGWQFELGGFVSSYIPTTGATATRAADVATISNLASIGFNATQGTLVAEFSLIGSGSPNRVVEIGANTSNRLAIEVASNVVKGPALSSAVVQVNIGTRVVTTNTLIKAAFGFQQDNFALAVNGLTAETDTSGLLPASFKEMRIGYGYDANRIDGYLRRIVYYPTRLSNTQIQALST